VLVEGYGLGRDIQELKEGLKRIEALLGIDTGVVTTAMAVSPRGINGGIDITNVRAEGDKICCDVHAYASASIAGRHWHWDKSWRDVCIKVGNPCYTLFSGDIGPANVKVDVCYEDGKICIVLEVEVFGLKRKWKECRGV
jgi:hypothetical protein